jgi:hypothetical protein
MSEVVGQRFKAWDGNFYVCDGRDENGYWMRREDAPDVRRNISWRAIGATYHYAPLPPQHQQDQSQ